MLTLIQQQLERELGQKIELKLVALIASLVTPIVGWWALASASRQL